MAGIMVLESSRQKRLSIVADELRSAIRDVGALLKAGHTSGDAWDAANARQKEAAAAFQDALDSISTFSKYQADRLVVGYT
jgi:Flp pilus assembly protein TadB